MVYQTSTKLFLITEQCYHYHSPLQESAFGSGSRFSDSACCQRSCRCTYSRRPGRCPPPLRRAAPFLTSRAPSALWHHRRGRPTPIVKAENNKYGRENFEGIFSIIWAQIMRCDQAKLLWLGMGISSLFRHIKITNCILLVSSQPQNCSQLSQGCEHASKGTICHPLTLITILSLVRYFIG